MAKCVLTKTSGARLVGGRGLGHPRHSICGAVTVLWTILHVFVQLCPSQHSSFSTHTQSYPAVSLVWSMFIGQRTDKWIR